MWVDAEDVPFYNLAQWASECNHSGPIPVCYLPPFGLQVLHSVLTAKKKGPFYAREEVCEKES